MRDVVEAQGGMTRAARLAGLNRESLYRQLSRRGNPTYFLPSDKSITA
jgi:DNA-binding phage protein